MQDRTLRRRLASHIAVRLMVATVLLGAAVVMQVRTPGAFPINPFFSLVALTYAVSLGFIASLRFVERQPWLTDVHFAIDDPGKAIQVVCAFPAVDSGGAIALARLGVISARLGDAQGAHDSTDSAGCEGPDQDRRSRQRPDGGLPPDGFLPGPG